MHTSSNTSAKMPLGSGCTFSGCVSAAPVLAPNVLANCEKKLRDDPGASVLLVRALYNRSYSRRRFGSDST